MKKEKGHISFCLNCTENTLRDKVKRKFQELGLNPLKTRCTVFGQGDSFRKKEYLITIPNPIYLEELQ